MSGKTKNAHLGITEVVAKDIIAVIATLLPPNVSANVSASAAKSPHKEHRSFSKRWQTISLDL